LAEATLDNYTFAAVNRRWWRYECWIIGDRCFDYSITV